MRLLTLAVVATAACTPGGKGTGQGLTPEGHVYFPIVAGTNHDLAKLSGCDACHPPAAESFKDFTCVSCHIHDQGISSLLHKGVGDYTFGERTCFTCHPTGEQMPFSHTGVVSSECATCHDVDAPFAALPIPGFTHRPMGTSGCGGCHNTQTWKDATGAPSDSSDPSRDVQVTGLVPTWSGQSIISLTPDQQSLKQVMNHSSTQVPAATLATCEACHVDAALGGYYPGELHSSLVTLGVTVSGCTDCHVATQPRGFVGPLVSPPGRDPASGEMRHEAVAWASGAPTMTGLVPQDCSLCHQAPSAARAATWVDGKTGAAPAKFHPSLTARVDSCLDCHANSRPTAIVSQPNGLKFDHQEPSALADCKTCHFNASALDGTGWAGGRFHLAGSATPATCLPCHDGRRPTDTTQWLSTTYTSRPFDYGTNSSGNTHGDGQDCALCHKGPGTGMWGGTPNWVGGDFQHGPNTPSAVRCISCHVSQRPTMPVGAPPAFNHATDGTGDCFGCHQATVTANRYQALSDWAGGEPYPASFISSTSRFITVSNITLNRSGPLNLVTSMSTTNVPLYQGMLHASTAIPLSMRPGSSDGGSNPDTSRCPLCHKPGGYADGVFHLAVTDAGLPQPNGQCLDCHNQMLAPGIVERMSSTLLPMDHHARFASDSGVTGLDCSTCHRGTPGTSWADGTFHTRIGAEQPSECVSCHYPLMASAAQADLTLMMRYRMQHRAPEMTTQACQTCHSGALGMATQTPVSTRWSGGALHSSFGASQPATCVSCHQVTLPAANASTQSSVTYSLAQGGTATNGAQWMNHGSPLVIGKDCVVCHRADAKATGSAWSKSAPFHASVTTATTCRECHGLTNGGGNVVGTRNNLPAGLIDSATLSTVPSTPDSGVPPGTHDQITHADVNVTGHDCNFCHTQSGPSTVAGVMGVEWAQARFHTRFTGSNPLVSDGVNGRCSNCHLNVKPGPQFKYNHSGFTSTPGSQDCASCHSWPGTGTSSAPNWKGATGAPATITLGPWTSGSNITSLTITLAHPPANTYTSCAQCHPGVNYAKISNYNHAGLTTNVTINGVAASPNLGSTLYNASTNPTYCVMCHNTGSPYLVSSGPLALVASTTSGSTTVTTASTADLAVGMRITGTPIPAGTITIRTITNATSFTISSAATATTTNASLTITHPSANQERIGNHEGSTAGEDCTSCHAGTGGREKLTPPVAGTFGNGKWK